MIEVEGDAKVAINFWQTKKYTDNSFGIKIPQHEDFKGFATGKEMQKKCDCCGNDDFDGERIFVCESCLDNEHFFCEDCEEYHHESQRAEGLDICENCAESGDYQFCEDCETWHHYERCCWVGGDWGHWVCEDCLSDYTFCEHCEEYFPYDKMHEVRHKEGDLLYACDSCFSDYEQCEECGEYYHIDYLEDGICPQCQDSENKKGA